MTTPRNGAGRRRAPGDGEAGPLDRRTRIDRSRARAWALQIHYRWETTGREGGLRDALVETQRTRRIGPSRLPWVRRLLTLLDEHGGEVDRRLQDALQNWRMERLSAIDRGVLRLAAVEMHHVPEVPPRVTIQEAIRLAEQYGGPDSPRFVNGVLDALYKRLGPT